MNWISFKAIMKEKGKNSTRNEGTSDLNIAGPKLRRQDYENKAIFKTQIGEIDYRR